MSSTFFYKKFSSLPENLKKEVVDFIDFLIAKKEKSLPNPKKKAPVFGSAKGMFKMADDFDAPLNDFKDYTN